MPISKAEAARRKNVSRAAVTHATRADGPLRAAVVAGGLDPTHPAFRLWLGEETRGPPAAVGIDDELRQLTRKKRAEEVERLKLANRVTRGELISRELVQVHVIGLIDATFTRLLRDAPRNIAARLLNHARAGGTLEEGIELVRAQISSQLGNLRTSARRSLGVAEPSPTTAPKKRNRT